MDAIADLLRRIEEEARRAPLSLDESVYARAGRDPRVPILFAGSLRANIAFLARDLGRDEVIHGEPLIGGAGRRVRSAVYEQVAGQPAPSGDPRLAPALERVLLTNTVPYKPVGNKAYPPAVRERFRPFIAELLCCHWRGGVVVTLGSEAFRWFAPYAGRAAVEEFWARPDRYEAEMACVIRADRAGATAERPLLVAPLPHPSPLNQAWWERFPALLRRRLERFL